MIEHIRTIGFKGFDLDEDVPHKVMYCGKNKAGKSTRAAAIALALSGYIPFSTAGKRPADILDSFGDGKLLVSAVKIGGKEFGRKISRNDKGTVSMVVQIDGKKKTAQEFAVALHDAGAPRIANVAEFMSQSENKKIDTLFDLFPVGDDLSALDNEIETAKAEVSNIDKKKTGAVAVVQRLTESKSKIELPSGSLAEVKTEIGAVEIQIKDLRNQIKDAEIGEAKENSKKEAEKNLLAEQKKESEQSSETKSIPDQGVGSSFIASSAPQIFEERGVVGPSFSSDPVVESDNFISIEQVAEAVADRVENIHNPSDSIKRIIGALENSGCSVCAAMIVAKQELKKYKRSQA